MMAYRAVSMPSESVYRNLQRQPVTEQTDHCRANPAVGRPNFIQQLTASFATRSVYPTS